jgi:hypothetical protein
VGLSRDSKWRVEDKFIGQDVCAALSGISLCHVAVAMAIALQTVRYLTEAMLLGTPCIVCCIFLCLECKAVDT